MRAMNSYNVVSEEPMEKLEECVYFTVRCPKSFRDNLHRIAKGLELDTSVFVRSILAHEMEKYPKGKKIKPVVEDPMSRKRR